MDNLFVICRYNGRIVSTTPVDSMELAVKFLKADAENTFSERNPAEKPEKEINEKTAKVSCVHGVWTWEVKEMKKYQVSGTAEVTVTTVVYAKNEKEALNKAAMEFEGISSFVGNGGTDKLIGVNGTDDTISADVQVEFDDCWEDE